MVDQKIIKEPFVVCTNCNERVRANTCNKNMFCECCKVQVRGNENSFEIIGNQEKITIVMEDPRKYIIPEHLQWT